ncbi:MAG: hypothetical protein AAF514_10555, partial [Verrucomicrobiota bacterium]
VRILVGLFVWAGFAAAEEKPKAPWRVELKETDRDRVTNRWIEENGSWILEVSDRRGIGSLRLKPLKSTMKKGLRIRLRLKGLEDLRLSGGDQTMNYAVSSTGKHLHRCFRENKPVPLGDPYRIEVKIKGKAKVGQKGGQRPVIPLGSDQWFEFQLPEKWLAEKVLDLRWVDFFRG